MPTPCASFMLVWELWRIMYADETCLALRPAFEDGLSYR